MKCPVCKDAPLVMAERQGIEIDYCQECRGVWLDRGELDKLVERSSRTAESAPAAARDDHRHRTAPQHYYGKRKSWIAEIFD
jgi:Zn-finger nucleic acid-binding protein